MVVSCDGCKTDYKMTRFDFTIFFMAVVKRNRVDYGLGFSEKPEVRASFWQNHHASQLTWGTANGC